MTKETFQMKDAETLKSEVIEDLGVEYEGNEEQVDKIVARRLKDEEFKASLHADKTKHLEAKRKKEELLAKAGLDPETGEKIVAKATMAGDTTPKNEEVFSPKDYLAMTENKITSEDFDEVVRLKKVLGKSDIAETLKDKTARLILDQRAEERRSAAIASAGTTRKTNKSGGEDLLKRADENKLSPEEMREAAKAVIANLGK